MKQRPVQAKRRNARAMLSASEQRSGNVATRQALERHCLAKGLLGNGMLRKGRVRKRKAMPGNGCVISYELSTAMELPCSATWGGVREGQWMQCVVLVEQREAMVSESIAFDG